MLDGVDQGTFHQMPIHILSPFQVNYQQMSMIQHDQDLLTLVQ